MPIAKAYMEQLRAVYAEADEVELMKMAVRMPDTMKTEREEIDENDWAQITTAIEEALQNILNFRKDEGQSLEKEFQLRIANIRQYMNEALALDHERVQTIKDRLHNAITELKVAVDENRFEQELIYYLEKLDITEALQNILTFRRDEGQSLEKEFQLRIANIRQYMNEALALDHERVQTIKDRLHNAITELKVAVDETRFEQELIYYLEKLDITEEKVRLTNHLDYFLETIKGTEANGRKLGFITQEMGREINTMGSKSNHAQMQKLVVQMKDELEKIKEQVLNVL